MKLLAPLLTLALAMLSATNDAAAPSRSGELQARCAAIPADRYVTGLIGNPDGMQTYYERSRCLQEAAVALRAPGICNGVRERRSWFFDGSAFSPQACRSLVSRQVQQDIAAATTLRPPQRLQRITVARNGNGRDFDVLVHTTGGDGIGMRLQLAVVAVSGTSESVVYDQVQAMDDAPEDLRLLVPQADVVRALATQPQGVPVLLRARLEKTMASDAERAVHAHAPQLPRTSVVEVAFDPGHLAWHPDAAIR